MNEATRIEEGFAESAGAARIVVPHPTNSQILYAGAANGGVLRSDTAGTSWTPLTDRQSSLSIGGLAMNASNPDHLVAGIGRFSTAGSQGGTLSGLLETTDGGGTWTGITLQDLGLSANQQTGIAAVAFAGTTVLAGGVYQRTDRTAYTSTGGLFRRTSGGSFARVGVDQATALSDPGKPLISTANVSSMAVDPANSAVIYAGVDKAQFYADPTLNGIYRSADNGATWTRETDTLPAGTLTDIMQVAVDTRVTVGPDGATYALIAIPGGRGERISLGLRRDPETGTWSEIEIPAQFASTNQADPHMAIAVNPDDPNILYAAGDPQSFWRGTRDPATGTVTWVSGVSTSLGQPHVDYRSIVFDAAGRMLVGTDGGVYATDSPTETAAWYALDQGLGTAEFYRVAWNPISHTAAGAAQDNGVFLQRSGSTTWDGINDQGDGVNVAVNGITYASRGQAIVYSTTQALGSGRLDTDIRRQIFDAANAQVGVTTLIDLDGINIDNDRTIPFDSPITLNRSTPTLIAVGTTGVFVFTDDPSEPGEYVPALDAYVGVLGSDDYRALTAESGVTFSGVAAAMDFGTATTAGANALLIGTYDDRIDPDSTGGLYYIADATDTADRLVRLPLTQAIEAVKAVELDPGVDNQFFAASDNSIYRFTAANCAIGGATCTPSDMADGLPDSFRDPRSLEVIDANGVRALLAGGYSATAPLAGGSNLYAVLDDATGTWASTAWSAINGTLPNAPVWSLEYADADDVLLIGTLGRGAFALYDASTTLFPTEVSELRFGMADNDSAPSASILTDRSGGVARLLRKSGSGTLTLSGTASYSGGTYLDGGTVSVSDDASLGASSGGLVFNGGTLLTTAAVTSARAITVNAGGGTFDTRGLTTLSGTFSGAGGFTKTGVSTLRLTGTAANGGGATVTAGLLQVDGSLTGNVAVGASGTLGGIGSITGTVSNAGTVAPGASIGTLTVNGSFVMTDTSQLSMELDQTSADQLIVNGTASLDGSLVLDVPDGTKLGGQSYSLVSATQVTGAFDEVIGLSPFLEADFVNTGTSLQTSFVRNFAAPATNGNQVSLGTALNSAYSLGAQGDLDAVFTALDETASGAPAQNALTQLSGQSLGDMTTASGNMSGMLARGMQGRLARLRTGGAQAAGAVSALSFGDSDGAGLARTGSALAGAGAGAGTGPATGLAAGDGPQAAAPRATSAWARAIGHRGHVDSDGNGTGYDTDLGGLQVGLDRTIDGRFVVGLSLAYLRSDLSAKEVTADTDGDTYQVGIYGAAALGPVDLDLTAAYARTDWRTSRSLSFGGLNRTATGAPTSNDIAVTARIGRDLAAGRFTVTPQAGLDWYRLDRSGFTESGAGAANLDVQSSSGNVVTSWLGARAATSFVLDGTFALRPELRGAWTHDLADMDPTVSATLAGAPGAPFTVTAAQPGRDAAVLGANLTGQGLSGAASGLQLFADYELQAAARERDHTVTLGLRYAF